MGGGSWLFVKELRSTWIELPRRHLLRIAGPGTVLDRREFTTGDELEEFLSSLTDRLIAEGWILAQIDYDRRRRVRRRRLRIAVDRRGDRENRSA